MSRIPTTPSTAWYCISVPALILISLSGIPAHRVKGISAPTGKQIYLNRCVACHGTNGQGTPRYEKILTGSRSASDLAGFIAKSMPPGPRKCPPAEARQVAAYIFDAFYSPVAQARIRPARIALSRLTIRQFRNAVADLIGSFRASVSRDERHGLRGEYFKTGSFRADAKILDRVDPDIHFNFRIAGALPDQNDPYQFAMRWDGSVVAADTGEYEFIVRTEHAVRLWINDLGTPLIDGYVKSGSDNEYHGSLYLLGGRSYRLRLEFSKGVVGVNDLTKLKQKPAAAASLSLDWKRPKQSEEVIPERCLSPVEPPVVFIPTTPFPPDDRSMGYERGTSVSKAWDEATTGAALETSGYVAAHLRDLSGVADGTKDREAGIRGLCRLFVERAFRRPLTDDVAHFYIDRQLRAAPNLETAVKRVVILTLKSPRFLYRDLGTGSPDPYDVASRLSFGLWDSLPDQDLLIAAGSGKLATRDQLAAQAHRMLADPRAWFKLREFFLQWLKVDQVPDLAKDPKRFPTFDASVVTDLRTSLDLYLQNVAWSDRSDFRELMLSDGCYLNGRLAKLYGVKLPDGAPFQPVALDRSERCGVLTQPYILSCFAYIDTSSPIHRGVLIARNLLGRILQPPPAAFAPIPAALHPDLTTRERVTLQTRQAPCNTCHGMINPLGFALERFDAIGRVRDTENGKPIDSSGIYRCSTGKTVEFKGARDLAEYLAGSDESHAAFVEKLFQYLTKQPIRAYGPHTLADLEQSFAASQYSIRELMAQMMATAALQR